ncbi:MFS transporter [Stappia sp. ES.058]|uniref:MFS transporter n=1 Tax=Stappia sp. ES.058 TaxID=1881061 RepID=UPI00087CE5E5|nr:MFS transporter [Stappia sp. ES.058]SDU44263.1 Major Facilitator Superfamily protein [Stappia sp. ES.058]
MTGRPQFQFFLGHFIWNLAFLQGVLIFFYADRGLSLAEVFLIKNMVSVIVVVTEIPSGLVSDLFGRRRALIIGALVKFVGCLIIALSSQFTLLAVAYGLIGVGVSFYSGTNIAIVYEMEQANADPAARHRALAQMGVLAGLAQFTSTLLGGLVATWSLDMVGWLNAAGAFAAVLVFLSYRLPEHVRAPAQAAATPKRSRLGMARDGLRHLAGQGNATAIVTAAVMVVALFMPMIAITTYQGVWKEMGAALEFAAAATAVAGLLSAGASYLVKRFLVAVAPIRFAVLAFLLLEVSVLLGALDWIAMTVVSIALMEILRAYVLIVGSVIVNDAVDDRFRATINSAISLVTRIVVVVLSPVWAFLLQDAGHASAFVWLAGVYAALFGAIALAGLWVRATIRRAPTPAPAQPNPNRIEEEHPR